MKPHFVSARDAYVLTAARYLDEKESPDRSARAEYIVPPNSDGRVASRSILCTPISVKS